MSYNIDHCKTRSINGLVIPVTALYTDASKRFGIGQPAIVDMAEMNVRIDIAEGCIEGRLKDGNLHVSLISIFGDGSGYAYEDVLKPALKQSKGEWRARFVWEGGDSINTLSVKDGEITEETED